MQSPPVTQTDQYSHLYCTCFVKILLYHKILVIIIQQLTYTHSSLEAARLIIINSDLTAGYLQRNEELYVITRTMRLLVVRLQL